MKKIRPAYNPELMKAVFSSTSPNRSPMSPRSPRTPRTPRPIRRKTMSSYQVLNSLLDTEQRLDRVIADVPQKGPGDKQKLPETLRIFLRFVDDDDSEVLLRVEGLFLQNEFLDRTIGRNRPLPPFMSLVESLTVTLHDNDSDRTITLEWEKPSSTEADGCDFLMPSILSKGFAITVEIVLKNTHPDTCTVFPIVRRHLKLGDHVHRRSDVAMAMWNYIKTHRLLDPADPQSIICNEFLRKLFVSRRLTYRELMDKMESVVINADTFKLKMELMLRCVHPLDEPVHAFDTRMFIKNKPQKRKRDPPPKNGVLGTSFAKAQMRKLLAQRNRLLRTRDFFTEFANDPQKAAKACVTSNQVQKQVSRRAEASSPRFEADHLTACWDDCSDVVVQRCFDVLKHAKSKSDEADKAEKGE